MTTPIKARREKKIMANEEEARNGRQLKGLKWKTQKALDGEGKDSLITESDEGKTIVNLGTDKELFSEGSDGKTAEIRAGDFVVTDANGQETVLSGVANSLKSEGSNGVLTISDGVLRAKSNAPEIYTAIYVGAYAKVDFANTSELSLSNGSVMNLSNGSVMSLSNGSSMSLSGKESYIFAQGGAALKIAGKATQVQLQDLSQVALGTFSGGAFTAKAVLPSMPTAEGTYLLQVAIDSQGVPTFSWAVQSQQ